MHIALFSPGWPPAIYPNGIVTYVHCLRQELLAQGHRVSVFTGEVDPKFSDPDVHRVSPRLADRFVRAFSKRILRRTSAAYDMAAILASAVARVNAKDPIDVIEMEESFGLIGDVARCTALPMVCRLHGPTFLTVVGDQLTLPSVQTKIREEGDGLRPLTAIIAASRCTLRNTLDQYALNPPITRQIVNPVPSRDTLPIWELATCDRNTLLFVGRFDAIKGADVLIRAFRRLIDQKPELKLVFVGPDYGLPSPDGQLIHLRDFVGSFADPDLERALSYRGRLDATEIIKLRPSALVTIVASRRETQCYVALEAMLQGCPLVCTDTTGLSELIEHDVNGVKARSEDPEDLAKQVQRLIDDPELAARLGRGGREYVLKNHAPGAVVEQMLEVYREAIHLHRQRVNVGK